MMTDGVLSRWTSLCRFLEDGTIEIDNNAVERATRPIAITGSDLRPKFPPDFGRVLVSIYISNWDSGDS